MRRGLVKQEERDIREIWHRIKKRDFSGNTGIAIKNSIYQTLTNLVAKIGSLIFIAILARILMPELFGLYSLALATILLFIGFTDLGITPTLVVFLSRALSKNNKIKAKSYLTHLFKLQLALIFITIFILIVAARFISEIYYQKPIFLALLVGAIYILFRSLISFSRSIFHSLNNFKIPLLFESFFQIFRIIIVPILTLFFLNYIIKNESYIFLIILSLSFVWFLTLGLILLFFLPSIDFIKMPSKDLSKPEKSKIKKFLLPLSITALAGVFFGYVGIIILGRFVESKFIGYYYAASSLIGSAVPLITFASVLFPIFSRMKGKKLKKALSKSVGITFLLGLIIALLVFLFSPIIITIIFGAEYSSSIPILRIFSLMILAVPLTLIYTSNLIARGKSSLVAKLLISYTLINLLFNFIVAFSLREIGQMAIVFGISIVTVVSNYLYLFGLIYSEKKVKEH